MTRNGWEHATIILPNAEVAKIKKALREHANQFHADVRAKAVSVHKSIGTRSVKLYTQKFHDMTWSHEAGRGRRATSVYDEAVKSTAYRVLERMIEDVHRGYDNDALHVPTVADVDQFAPRATNRTNGFFVIGLSGFCSATVTFDGRTVTWDVPEGNHNVEGAHASPLALVFFEALDSVKWTRGTGGYGTGNDEYNEDDREYGGGANYMTFTYGPLGEQAEESRRRAYTF